MKATRIELTPEMRGAAIEASGPGILFQQCPVCGDDIDIHEWLEIFAGIGRIVDCDRRSTDPTTGSMKVEVNDEFVMYGVRHTVTAVTPKSIRYRTAARDGWEGIPYTTTSGAFHALVAAGVIVRVDASNVGDKA